ncbi:MAG: adenylyltransferase/cytidyltransferase family protein [Thermoplasmata archaeon]|nr:adenylyltransferase/cytidyltransferase family protein [Thermoplasmata archaeon]
MVRVMATGVFDLLHPGHLYFLTEAKKLGDELVVVVARDQTARRLKHEPYVPEHLRRAMVEGLKPVDRAILGSTTDIYQTVVEVRPDLIALGHNQLWNEREVEAECARRGVPAKVVRLGVCPYDDLATRRIVERILASRPASADTAR